MAPAATERPPSEQTVENRLLDALGAVQTELEALKQRLPQLVAVQPNWWDQLPAEIGEWLVNGAWYQFVLPSRGPHQVVMRTACMTDRLDLWLEADGGYRAWQRSLFFGKRRFDA